ncbi:MAG: alpha/beta fold hydrolase [Nocardioides sp.]|nr:alpha/beta fold hydrolase [Nocardioides sp.]
MTTYDAESTSRHVTAAGVRLRVHEAGTGPLLLLIHGGAPGATGWANFGQNLPAFADHFRTVIVDLPGYGESEMPASIEGGRYTFYGDVFAALVAELGETSAHVVGLATGGAAALAMALDHPEVVSRLVLVSSAGGLPIFSTMPSEGQKAVRGYYRGEGPSREKMRAYLGLSVHDQSIVTDELVEQRYQNSIQARGSEPGSPEQLWARVAGIAAPTLVIWGRDNRLQGYDNALFFLQQIPDVEVHIFGRTGLWIPFERQSRFESLVLDYLS